MKEIRAQILHIFCFTRSHCSCMQMGYLVKSEVLCVKYTGSGAYIKELSHCNDILGFLSSLIFLLKRERGGEKRVKLFVRKLKSVTTSKRKKKCQK